jgi:hypothetical protein
MAFALGCGALCLCIRYCSFSSSIKKARLLWQGLGELGCGSFSARHTLVIVGMHRPADTLHARLYQMSNLWLGLFVPFSEYGTEVWN